MRKSTKVICNTCEKEFLKANSEIKRSKSKKHFCSLSCNMKWNHKNGILDYKHPNIYNISQHSTNKIDIYTPFKWYLKNVRQRTNKNFDITLQDLKTIWDNQNGICPYTKIKLKLKTYADSALHTFENPFIFASLDRIDSSKGYTIDNIEFISVGVNFLKNRFSKEQTLLFINNIKEQDA